MKTNPVRGPWWRQIYIAGNEAYELVEIERPRRGKGMGTKDKGRVNTKGTKGKGVRMMTMSKSTGGASMMGLTGRAGKGVKAMMDNKPSMMMAKQPTMGECSKPSAGSKKTKSVVRGKGKIIQYNMAGGV